MNTWNDIEHGFAPARATQYTISDADQLAATLYKLFHGRYVKNDNGHVITLSDGTSLTITLGDNNTTGENVGTGAHSQDMRAHADRRIIERAWLHETEKWDDANTYTQRLYVQCENEDEPRLLTEATFTHEPYDDWDALYLIAFDKDEW